MSWTGCQNNPINLKFYLQKSLEIFEKNSAGKICSNKDIKVKVPCPMPDRVKLWYIEFDSFLAGLGEIECTVHVALPKRPINQFKPIYQNS